MNVSPRFANLSVEVEVPYFDVQIARSHGSAHELDSFFCDETIDTPSPESTNRVAKHPAARVRRNSQFPIPTKRSRCIYEASSSSSSSNSSSHRALTGKTERTERTERA